jgi:hypothetical protein
MAYIPAPIDRIAVFQSEIDLELTLVSSGASSDFYGQDSNMGDVASGYLLSDYFVRGANNGLPTSINGVNLVFYTEANVGLIQHDGDLDPFLPGSQTGIWDNTFYVSYLYSNNSGQDIFISHKFWDIDLSDPVFDPDMTGLVNTSISGLIPPPIAGDDFSLDGSNNGNMRVAGNNKFGHKTYSMNGLTGDPWTRYFYYIIFTATSAEFKSAFYLTWDTDINFSSSRNITTTNGIRNYSMVLNETTAGKVLVGWNETAFIYQGEATDQDTFNPILSEPDDQIDWLAFTENGPGNLFGYMMPCRDGWIISWSDWSSGYYRFFYVNADWTKYWRINWVNMPPAYDGIACFIWDDQGNITNVDDYYDVYIGPFSIGSSVEPLNTRNPMPVALPCSNYCIPLFKQRKRYGR